MTLSTAEPQPQPASPPRWHQLSTFALPLAAFLFAILTALACRSAAGVSLGLFFGGVAFVTLLVPPLVGGEVSFRRRLSIPVLVTVGIAFVWLTALGERLTFGQWLACCAALLAYAFALGGVCSLLVAIRVNAILAAGLVTVVGLLWLTWPVWLSAVLKQRIGDTLVAWLVPPHPLFGINAVLGHMGTWDRYPLAYSRLTVLNQDVFYSLPTGVLWTTITHLFIAVVSITLTRSLERSDTRRVRSEAEPRI